MRVSQKSPESFRSAAGAQTLLPLEPERDAEALHAVFGDADQLRFMLRPPCATVAETEALLSGWNEDASSPQWSIFDEKALTGRITLVRQRSGVYEVGVQVVPDAQGRGIATRAIVTATEYAFHELNAVRVYADIDPHNTPCIRAFQRAGYRYEGILIANWHTEHGTFDSEIYAATAGWAA